MLPKLNGWQELCLVAGTLIALAIIFRVIAWIERDPGNPTDFSARRKDGGD